MTCNDEKLSATMHKYEILYDKSQADFHRNDKKKNAWKAVSEELGLKDGFFKIKVMLDFQEFITEAMSFTIVYSGILEVKDIVLLGKEAEKAFIKLKDRYGPAKKQ